MLQKVEKKTDDKGREIRIDNSGREYAVWYDAVGNEYHEYQYISNEKSEEEKKEEKERKWKYTFDHLFDDCDEDEVFQQEYGNYDWDGTEYKADDDKIINRYDFYNKDFKDQQYYIYRQLVNISSHDLAYLVSITSSFSGLI